MKLEQTAPLIPLAIAAPPLAMFAAIGLGVIWLLSKGEPIKLDPFAPDEGSNSAAGQTDDADDVPQATPKRITREDLAEALKYGAQPMTRKQAVKALQALGFRKSSAYMAIAPSGRFAELLEFTQDGLVEWKG